MPTGNKVRMNKAKSFYILHKQTKQLLSSNITTGS